VGLTTLPCKKKIVEKLPRNSAGFCGGGQGLSWAVEPRKEERKKEYLVKRTRYEAPLYAVFSSLPPFPFFLLGPNILYSTLFSKILNL
jgi:hypothetical protein